MVDERIRSRERLDGLDLGGLLRTTPDWRRRLGLIRLAARLGHARADDWRREFQLTRVRAARRPWLALGKTALRRWACDCAASALERERAAGREPPLECFEAIRLAWAYLDGEPVGDRLRAAGEEIRTWARFPDPDEEHEEGEAPQEQPGPWRGVIAASIAATSAKQAAQAAILGLRSYAVSLTEESARNAAAAAAWSAGALADPTLEPPEGVNLFLDFIPEPYLNRVPSVEAARAEVVESQLNRLAEGYLWPEITSPAPRGA